MFANLKLLNQQENSQLLTHYLELIIRPELMRLKFNSVTEVRDFVKDIQQALHANQSPFEIARYTDFLNEIKALYDNDYLYVYDVDVDRNGALLDDFRILLLQQLYVYTQDLANKSDTELNAGLSNQAQIETSKQEFAEYAQQLKNKNVAELKQLIEEYSDIHPDRAELAKQELATRNTDIITPAQCDEIAAINAQDFPNTNISYTTKTAEAALCIDVATLLLTIYAYNRNIESLYFRTRQDEQALTEANIQADYLRILAHYFRLEKEKCASLLHPSNIITDIMHVMHNIMGVFNGSKLTLARYHAYTSEEMRRLILANPAKILDALNSLDNDTFDLYINVVFLLDQTNYVLSDPEVTSTYKSFLKIAIKTFLSIHFSIILGDDFTFLRASKELEKIKKIFNDLIVPEALDLTIFDNTSITKLEFLADNYAKIAALKAVASKGVTVLLPLPVEQLMRIFDKNERIIKFCKRLGLDLEQLLSADTQTFEFLLSEDHRLDRIVILVQYYGIDLNRLLSLPHDELAILINHPHKAVALFNVQTKPYTIEQLQDIVSRFSANQTNHLTALNSNSYILQIGSMWNNLRQFNAELRDLGLDFYAYRAIIDTFYLQNSSFIIKYLHDYINANERLILPEVTDSTSLEIRLTPAAARMVGEHLKASDQAMATCIEQRNLDTDSAQFSALYAALYQIKQANVSYADADSTIRDQFLILRSELQQVVRELTTGNLHVRHLLLLRDLYALRSDVYQDSESIRNAIESMRATLRIHSSTASNWYLPIENAHGEDLMARNISDCCKLDITDLFAKAYNPIGHNHKQYSYLACALLTYDAEIIECLQQKIRTNTTSTLNIFLQTNGFKSTDLDGINRKGDTPLTLAIQQGDRALTLVQALLVRGVNPNVLTANGKSPIQYALEAQHADNLVVVNDILLAKQFKIQPLELLQNARTTRTNGSIIKAVV